jgi:tRNA modification GTPase
MYRVVFSNGDDGLAGTFALGKSYTGEEAIELHVHGSPRSVSSLVDLCIEAGARFARPGEFSERAFLNGKLDLSQAEYVNDTVRATTERQLSLANEGRNGALHQAIKRIESILERHLATIEASVDFSEEIGEADTEQLSHDLVPIQAEIDDLIRNAERGRFIREGMRIAIVGKPNAGKSSLLNRILGVQRAIVTEIAGTTRDYVEESCELAGIPCVLIDTAGIRESEDLVECIGIQNARIQAARADLVWYLFDSTIGITIEDQNEMKSFTTPLWMIPTKSDVTGVEDGISSYTGEGLDRLISRISEWVPDISGVVPNRRHRICLLSTAASLNAIQEGIANNHPDDLLVTHYRSALHELGLITGSSASDDLLDRIFRDFCIGK